MQERNETDTRISVSCVAASEIPPSDLIKIDTEGCEVEILANLDLTKTKAILLEHHSKSDAATIKKMLTPKYRILHDESDLEVGTMIFVLAEPV
ncbi:FkbM family methyltransferase [Escherichia coli]